MPHTKEPWGFHRHTTTNVESIEGRTIATTGGYSDNFSGGKYFEENEANARRIVACVNALAGYNPDAVADVVAALEAVVNFETGAWDDAKRALTRLRSIDNA